ncbi:XRE family transcriptional regulator [Alteromonas stellipolaris]|uniref:XRE family transcriptional regulator n=1 Tax=Alteromonas stellipolaris TaxID=233316 RepID=UPI0007B4546F|nr:S24 family peptidase [Alteromonas stellipolaris]ANB27206.1 XRE family transcriptional regulator [Alteromonas stellipolaris]
MKENYVTSRLKEVMLKHGVRNADLARVADVSPQAVGRWFKTNSISKKSLSAISKHFNIPLDWLMTGEGSLTGPSKISESSAEYIGSIDSWDSKTPLSEDDVEVPFYMEVELSAGNGSAIQIETNGPKLRFSKATLRKRGVDVEAAACVRVSGNSMEPVIPDGATVGVDTSKVDIIKDGDMYAIDWAGSLFVKILNRRPGGGISIRSFNSDEYPTENLSFEETKDVRVIGRVFWYSVLI